LIAVAPILRVADGSKGYLIVEYNADLGRLIDPGAERALQLLVR
jgi:hypothetical protein